MHSLRPMLIGTLMLIRASGAYAGLTDQHSIPAISEAISSPIPAAAVEHARQYDDQLLRTGTWNQLKVYLVTDERAVHVSKLVEKLLNAMGEDTSGWVVRILDTTPKTANAFVVGGKYVYVFTGLVDEAKSDDEIAFVVGHELGHSLLKHGLRQQNDMSSVLANLATIFAASLNGSKQESAMAMAKALHNSYTQIDEREADTFGVIASWRAGFNPLRGADFFSRMARADDEEQSKRDHAFEENRATADSLLSECQARKNQWNAGQLEQSNENAAAINQLCANALQQAQSYNVALAQSQLDDANRQVAKLSSDHPDPQERIAAIAALTDYLRGARPIESLGAHEQARRVITALLQKDSALLNPVSDVHQVSTAAVLPTKGPSDDSARLQKLKEMLQSGLIDQADYDKKKQEILTGL